MFGSTMLGEHARRLADAWLTRSRKGERSGGLALGLQLCVLMYFVLKVSWLADDAYITLRTVDNFLHGYGLRWNVGERVQVYTHPLWMFALVPFKALLSSSLLAMMVPGWLASIAAFYLLLRSGASVPGRLVAFLTLALSPSLIDFSTSGLENPLSHLLLVGALLSLPSEGKSLGRFALWVSLLVLNRNDLVLIVGPLTFAEIVRSKAPFRWRTLLLATLPLSGWLFFSTVYYGSPLPNTYFAKITGGIPSERYWTQGLRYALDIALYEPLTLAIVLAGITVAWKQRADRTLLLLAVGMSIHLAYVLKIGGDFMNARFLTPHVVASAWIFLRAADAHWRDLLPDPGRAAAIATAVTLTSFAVLAAADLHSFASRKSETHRASSITDERQMYFPATGLWGRVWAKFNGKPFDVDYEWANLGRKLRAEPRSTSLVHINMGFLGYYAGPKVNIIDALGLTDPFVARLPVDHFWTAGHGARIVPPEYVTSVDTGKNRLKGRRLRALFDDLALVTRSNELWSMRRFSAIWRLNTNHYADISRS